MLACSHRPLPVQELTHFLVDVIVVDTSTALVPGGGVLADDYVEEWFPLAVPTPHPVCLLPNQLRELFRLVLRGGGETGCWEDWYSIVWGMKQGVGEIAIVLI